MASVVCSSGLVAVFINRSDWSVAVIPISRWSSVYSFFLSALSMIFPGMRLGPSSSFGKDNLSFQFPCSVLESFQIELVVSRSVKGKTFLNLCFCGVGWEWGPEEELTLWEDEGRDFLTFTIKGKGQWGEKSSMERASEFLYLRQMEFQKNKLR